MFWLGLRLSFDGRLAGLQIWLGLNSLGIWFDLVK